MYHQWRMASSVNQMTNHERTLEIFQLKTDTGGNEALLAALDDGVRWTIPCEPVVAKDRGEPRSCI